jgi:hypothetical protein
MHVQSDIFCSASLTLPDSVGRQINIGGWANDATYGIRLYWPDGKPGVAGVNDWQENFQEVSLIDGRWYPSAMTMSNGSILVMAGEVGSNGAPVPSLEVLPSPSGQPSHLLQHQSRQRCREEPPCKSGRCCGKYAWQLDGSADLFPQDCVLGYEMHGHCSA